MARHEEPTAYVLVMWKSKPSVDWYSGCLEACFKLFKFFQYKLDNLTAEHAA
jgi:hypothetical protein